MSILFCYGSAHSIFAKIRFNTTMGTYCNVHLNGYQIDSNKSYIAPFYSAIFNESDKRSRMVNWHAYYTEPPEGQTLVNTTEYATSVKVLKSRLELLGFTLDDANQYYVYELKKHLDFYREHLFEENSIYDRNYIQHFELLREKGLAFWLSLVRAIMDSNKHSWDLSLDRNREVDDLQTFILDLSPEEFWLGFPTPAFGYFLRSLLESADDDHEFVLDITSLVAAGYYDQNERVCELTAQSQLDDVRMFQKIIIMTEGKSDTEFLRRALNILHPELNQYFSFFEFDHSKAEGGAPALERNVKAFAAAGISNKIVALFDNDAAGLSAIHRLSKVTLPSNISVLALPNISIANNYPTVGAQGISTENVNGRACSIEMYFGIDILKTEDNFNSVFWKGVDETTKTYQGELQQKSELQRLFRAKLDSAERCGIYENKDWTGIEMILQTIFKESVVRNFYHINF